MLRLHMATGPDDLGQQKQQILARTALLHTELARLAEANRAVDAAAELAALRKVEADLELVVAAQRLLHNTPAAPPPLPAQAGFGTDTSRPMSASTPIVSAGQPPPPTTASSGRPLQVVRKAGASTNRTPPLIVKTASSSRNESNGSDGARGASASRTQPLVVKTSRGNRNESSNRDGARGINSDNKPTDRARPTEHKDRGREQHNRPRDQRAAVVKRAAAAEGDHNGGSRDRHERKNKGSNSAAPCRFFTTNTCRAGNTCQWLHEATDRDRTAARRSRSHNRSRSRDRGQGDDTRDRDRDKTNNYSARPSKGRSRSNDNLDGRDRNKPRHHSSRRSRSMLQQSQQAQPR